MDEQIQIMNVGDLRKAVAGQPEHRQILGQVVAANGRAWYMNMGLVAKLPNGTVGVLSMSHPDLKTLPSHGQVSFEGPARREPINGIDSTVVMAKGMNCLLAMGGDELGHIKVEEGRVYKITVEEMG